ncbi:guanine permease [Shewanella hanedai]|uniref:NCS2 family permease n=1 Tax=Shewanella hanedai TaxID=25 RepID=A0A553JJQ0_SHEHA|nr:NCS2 family permease [Shewanella hanedai]TRY12690.1 NCS2 family permease [Shewanella hanedai]GGI94250.1 guanine permease [Shewanella hanedai]
MDKYFLLSERGATVKNEIYAGIITFLAMSYILAVNPAILGSIDGIDKGAIFTATALSSAIATFIMGAFSKYPIMLAPGMSMNGFFKAILLGGGLSLLWNEALLAIFLSGCIYLVLSLTPARKVMIEAIPEDLKLGIAVGLGLFVSFLGFKNAGIIVSNPIILVSLGDVYNPQVFIALCSIFIAIACLVRDMKLATVIAFISSIILSLLSDHFLGSDLISLPTAIFSAPPSLAPTFGAIFDLSQFSLPKLSDLLFLVIIFFIVDFFDGLSTIIGVGRDAGIIGKDGKVPNAKSALVADAGGTMIGAVLGTTSITAYSESAVASSIGAKTGLSAITVAVLFLIAMFLFPVFSIFTVAIVSPALVIIGIYMMKNLAGIQWHKKESAIPVFFIMVFSLLTFSPANGMAMGFISYCFVMLVQGDGKKVHPIIYALALLFITYLALS